MNKRLLFSETIIENYLMEVENINMRMKSIIENYDHIQNKNLKKRLQIEYSQLEERLNSVRNIAKNRIFNSSDKVSFSHLLFEICKRNNLKSCFSR